MDKRHQSNQIVRENIGNALMMLMKKKTLSEITVTEIITKAGVARASYYRNFKNKEDIIHSYIASLLVKIRKDKIREENFSTSTYEKILGLFRCFEKYKDNLQAFEDSVLTKIIANILSDIHITGFERKDDGYYSAAFNGALEGTVKRWFKNGCSESPKEMADSFYGIWFNPQRA